MRENSTFDMINIILTKKNNLDKITNNVLNRPKDDYMITNEE